VPRRTNALNSIEKMREKASMLQQQWIIGLTSPTIIANIASFEHRIPECDLKGWILQNDAPQCICTGASTQFSELPFGVLKKHVVISQMSWPCSEATSIAPAFTRLYSAAARPNLASE
jgi:hypothetical protein